MFDRPRRLMQTGQVTRPTGAACLLAVLTLAVAPLAPAPTGAAPRASCKKAGSKTVARNGFARLYEVGPKLYGCRRDTGRRVLLAEAYDDDYVSSGTYGDVRLNGRFAAWTWETHDISCKAACPPGYNPRNAGIGVFDLRRRRGRTVTPTDALPGGLVVSRSGTVAWLTRADSASPVVLHVSRRLSEDTVLDSGNIDPASLGIEITIISWRKDGAEHFARLR